MISPSVEVLILQCLEKDPRRRPNSMREVCDRLRGAPASIASDQGATDQVMIHGGVAGYDDTAEVEPATPASDPGDRTAPERLIELTPSAPVSVPSDVTVLAEGSTATVISVVPSSHRRAWIGAAAALATLIALALWSHVRKEEPKPTVFAAPTTNSPPPGPTVLPTGFPPLTPTIPEKQHPSLNEALRADDNTRKSDHISIVARPHHETSTTGRGHKAIARKPVSTPASSPSSVPTLKATTTKHWPGEGLD